MERLAARVGEIIVDDAGLAANGTPCRPSPRPSGCASLIDNRDLARAGGGRPGGRDDLQIIAVGSRQRDGGRGELAALRGGLRTPDRTVRLRDLARTIASLVALSAANMRVRRSFCSSVLAFSSARSKFSSANDTLSASRCSSSANSGVNVSRLGRDEEHHADGSPVDQQRKRRRRTARPGSGSHD